MKPLNRLCRDLLFAGLGAIVAAGTLLPATSRAQRGAVPPGAASRAAGGLPRIPADDPGNLLAWSLREDGAGAGGGGGAPFAPLADRGGRRPSGLAPCRLPAGARLVPLPDAASGLPVRVGHWLDGGPRLWLVRLERGPAVGEGDAEPMAGGPADSGCADGRRLLVPAETLLNQAYERARRGGGDGHEPAAATAGS